MTLDYDKRTELGSHTQYNSVMRKQNLEINLKKCHKVKWSEVFVKCLTQSNFSYLDERSYNAIAQLVLWLPF